MADQDNWPANPNEPQSTKSSGGGGCLKIVLIVGALGLVCMVVCCGGAFYFGSQFVPKVTNNAAEVAGVGQQIMKIDIPAEFEGEGAVTIDNAFMTMRIANFKRKTGDSQLMLLKMEMKFGDMKGQGDEFKNKMSGPKADDLDIQKTETREFDINGEKVPFKFSEAVNRETKVGYHIVEAQMGTPTNFRTLRLVIEDDDYDEAEVVKMIESIR